MKKKAPKSAWKKGQSGNPSGRAPGTRVALTQDIISAICADFKENGAKVIEDVRLADPATYLKVAVSLVPKEHNIIHTIVDELKQLPADEIRRRLDRIRQSRSGEAGDSGISPAERTH
jgi:hypothetical protein